VAVKLRLMRMGKKKHPTYRIVASDSRSPRDGRFIEIVGTYAPRDEPSGVQIDNKRAVEWLTNGAKASDRVRKLLEISGAWGEFKTLRPERPAKPERKRKETKKAGKKQATKAAKKTATKAPAKKAAAKKAAPVVEEAARVEAPEKEVLGETEVTAEAEGPEAAAGEAPVEESTAEAPVEGAPAEDSLSGEEA
jgi:small subunit ribosomal protein S16